MEQINIRKTDDIAEIGIDYRDQLFIKPCHQHFEFIYRAAAEVGWDEIEKLLFSPNPREWSYFDWYKHMITIVKSEYGCNLTITSRTHFSNLSVELIDQIKEFTIE